MDMLGLYADCGCPRGVRRILPRNFPHGRKQGLESADCFGDYIRR